jgi:hypothetical protein
MNRILEKPFESFPAQPERRTKQVFGIGQHIDCRTRSVTPIDSPNYLAPSFFHAICRIIRKMFIRMIRVPDTL